MSEKQTTKEKQYQFLLERQQEHGLESFGLMSSQTWQDDPRRLVFLLSRYKFVSKMFSGFEKVLEVGCADAFGTRIVRQEVGHITASDFDPVLVDDAKTRYSEKWGVDYLVHDMLSGPIKGQFDGGYACDVLEHIQPRDEEVFVGNIVKSVSDTGVVIFGMPSLESQDYASASSKAGHVNCKTAPEFKVLMQKFFNTVFIFSMNDEVVHTGFHKMAHYIFAVGCHKK